MSSKTSLLLAGAALATIAVGSVAQAPAAEAVAPSEYIGCATTDPVGCLAADDVNNWASSTAAYLFPNSPDLEDDEADAWRHCAGSAALTQRIGSTRAEAITTRHETANEPSSMMAFAMDMGNNRIGRAVGEAAEQHGGDDTWGWIMNRCLELGDANRLYGLGYDPTLTG